MTGQPGVGTVFAPGEWRCPKCGFRLTQRVMHAQSGAIATRDDAGERCPNDDSPLWRMTIAELDVESAERLAFMRDL